MVAETPLPTRPHSPLRARCRHIVFTIRLLARSAAGMDIHLPRWAWPFWQPRAGAIRYLCPARAPRTRGTTRAPSLAPPTIPLSAVHAEDGQTGRAGRRPRRYRYMGYHFYPRQHTYTRENAGVSPVAAWLNWVSPRYLPRHYKPLPGGCVPAARGSAVKFTIALPRHSGSPPPGIYLRLLILKLDVLCNICS